jgi:hypothetical protein
VYVFVVLTSIIILCLYKLTPLEQVEVTLQLSVSLPDLVLMIFSQATLDWGELKKICSLESQPATLSQTTWRYIPEEWHSAGHLL